MWGRSGGTVLLLALATAAPAQADVSGPAIVGFLNAQRAAHGIPAGIAEDPGLSDGCRKHNEYGARNDELTHVEDPAKPGYTAEGDRAGRTSVLYRGGPWTAARNPFETAPIHLHQLLAPRIDRMGASEDAGWGCATTLASRARPAPAADVTYTYPGDGTTGWRAAEVAREGPYTPGQVLGVPQGEETGPYLYASFDGPDVGLSDDSRVTQASLTGPAGPVELLVADGSRPEIKQYIPVGAQLIPRRRLAAGTTYTATLTAVVATRAGDRTFRRRWSFTTAGLPNDVRIVRWTKRDRTLRVEVASDAPGAVVRATGPGATVTTPVGAGGVATLEVGGPGDWRTCARSGGAGTEHVADEDCVTIAVTDGPPPPPPPPPATSPPPPATSPPPPSTSTTPSPSPSTSTTPAPGPTTAGTDPATATPADASPAPAPPGPLTELGAPSILAPRLTGVLPSRARPGRPIPLRLGSSRTWTLRVTVTTRSGRVVLRRRQASYAAGTRTVQLRVPRRWSRRGTSLRVRAVVTSAGVTRTFSRTVRVR